MSKKLSNDSNTKRDSELESLLHSEHTVSIEKIAVGGDGIARLGFQDKSIVVFIPYSAPADKLKIKITSVEKTFLKAEILEILEASPTRRKAPCMYYGKCGGCNLQHLTEAEQIQQKELILKDLFKKFLPNAEYTLLPTVSTDQVFHYRNRIQLKQIESLLGYFESSSHKIVDIESCLIAEKEISVQIPIIKAKLRPAKELTKYELRLNQEGKFDYYKIGTHGEGLSFSQVNNSINDKLVSKTTDIVVSENPQFITELYAGAGNFTFSFLQRLENTKLESAELNSELTHFSTKLLVEKKLQKRLFVFTADCDSFVQRRALSQELVFLDPPRPGCSKTVLSKLALSCPQNIVYVSCNPVTLARDLQFLFSQNPNYKIKFVQIFDMFPQTDHFETLVHLKLG